MNKSNFNDNNNNDDSDAEFQDAQTGYDDDNPITIYDIKSMDKFLERKEKARNMQLAKQVYEKSIYHYDNDTYLQSREIARQGPVPFQFPTDLRKVEKLINPTNNNNSMLYLSTIDDIQTTKPGENINETRYYSSKSLKSHKSHMKSSKSHENTLENDIDQKGPPQLIIDVKLGPNRIKHVEIRTGDNPRILATNFCTLFSLDPSACSLLSDLIQQNMEVNGLEMT